jgi:hypothetical protein
MQQWGGGGDMQGDGTGTQGYLNTATHEQMTDRGGVGEGEGKGRGGGGEGGAGGESDDDLKIIGHEGHLALVDFPHAREHCVTHAFGTQVYCRLCFSIVCDVNGVPNVFLMSSSMYTGCPFVLSPMSSLLSALSCVPNVFILSS